MGAILIVTTVGSEEEASTIARELVARRQAACVNVLPGIRSIYRWEGKVCETGELMLLVKTLEAELAAVTATIHELHSYDLPEILSFPLDHGEPRFLHWIAASVNERASVIKPADVAHDADP